MVWFARALVLFAVNAMAFLFGRSVAMRFQRRYDPWAEAELGLDADDALKGESAHAPDLERSQSQRKPKA